MKEQHMTVKVVIWTENGPKMVLVFVGIRGRNSHVLLKSVTHQGRKT